MVSGPHEPTAETGRKVMRMAEAIAAFVRDGDTVALEGFTHLIPYAAGHEIIRQRRRNLTLCRLTPDLLYDQLIAAGCARKLVFSWAGNPGVGSLHAFRRAVEHDIPHPLETEEYSHFGMIMRLVAGASRLSFMPLRSYRGSQIPDANPMVKTVACPYTGEEYFVVPALTPDVAIIHAQRADADGNTQVWGLLGVQKEVSFAATRVIVVVEEIVPSEIIRADPNRTLIPGCIVSAVVHEPFGAHPSYVHGFYDRDNDFYDGWDAISRDPARLEAYLDEMVFGSQDRTDYVRKLAPERLKQLRAAAQGERR